MIFNVWTFLFEVVNFLVLVYVLQRLFYRPLHEAIDRRREANAKAQADAQKAGQEAAALKQQLNTRLAALDQERQELIRAAREQTEADRKATIAEAERAARNAVRTRPASLKGSAPKPARRFVPSSFDPPSSLRNVFYMRLRARLSRSNLPGGSSKRYRTSRRTSANGCAGSWKRITLPSSKPPWR